MPKVEFEDLIWSQLVFKTLPEAQRTQGIDFITWVNLSARIIGVAIPGSWHCHFYILCCDPFKALNALNAFLKGTENLCSNCRNLFGRLLPFDFAPAADGDIFSENVLTLQTAQVCPSKVNEAARSKIMSFRQNDRKTIKFNWIQLAQIQLKRD